MFSTFGQFYFPLSTDYLRFGLDAGLQKDSSMQRIILYLQLCRFAAVFTAMADVFLGYLLTHKSLEPGGTFTLLVVASSSLYLAGMVFNDVFDRGVDVFERPGRPIPSGRVSVRAAVIFGTMLMVMGLGSSLTASLRSVSVVLPLVACIFLYNGRLKDTPVGPVVMGACRFFNVLLGASTAEFVWAMPQLHVAGALSLYIAGVTWFARDEAERSRRAQLAAAMGTVNLGLALLVAFVLNWPKGVPGMSFNVAVMLGFIAITINRRLITALIDPRPANVQASIKLMLLSLVMLDASIVLFVQPSPLYGIGVACLIGPALLLSRFLAVT